MFFRHNVTPLHYSVDHPGNTTIIFPHPDSIEVVPPPMSSLPFVKPMMSLYNDYVEPHLTKENVDNYITQTVTTAVFFGAVTPVLGLGTSFVAKAIAAAGLKVFGTVVSPFVAQFVDSFTDIQVANAQWLTQKVQCAWNAKNCEATTPSLENNLFNDFSTFDTASYVNTVSEGLNQLTVKGLMVSSLVSATSSKIKDVSFDAVGFSDYCQGYFCKNWIEYYYKEWIKSEIKQALPDAVKDNPIPLSDVIDTTSSTPLPIADSPLSNATIIALPVSLPFNVTEVPQSEMGIL